jgi:hypothetical protein
VKGVKRIRERVGLPGFTLRDNIGWWWRWIGGSGGWWRGRGRGHFTPPNAGRLRREYLLSLIPCLTTKPHKDHPISQSFDIRMRAMAILFPLQ